MKQLVTHMGFSALPFTHRTAKTLFAATGANRHAHLADSFSVKPGGPHAELRPGDPERH